MAALRNANQSIVNDEHFIAKAVEYLGKRSDFTINIEKNTVFWAEGSTAQIFRGQFKGVDVTVKLFREEIAREHSTHWIQRILLRILYIWKNYYMRCVPSRDMLHSCLLT